MTPDARLALIAMARCAGVAGPRQRLAAAAMAALNRELHVDLDAAEAVARAAGERLEEAQLAHECATSCERPDRALIRRLEAELQVAAAAEQAAVDACQVADAERARRLRELLA